MVCDEPDAVKLLQGAPSLSANQSWVRIIQLVSKSVSAWTACFLEAGVVAVNRARCLDSKYFTIAIFSFS